MPQLSWFDELNTYALRHFCIEPSAKLTDLAKEINGQPGKVAQAESLEIEKRRRAAWLRSDVARGEAGRIRSNLYSLIMIH
ncbi:MAG: hypothetical protein DMG79_06190 [Acidobacteria bacterium]|nr:MAG: hypothetical protein DMG79_06190 [Acidobacteriota bacterium]